jgi:RNA polymerase sigma factor (sigma-70 family)
MSPLLLRRYRADRLLREEFEALRERVIAAVAGRLRASGAAADREDLEAAYALAWQGLHAAVLEGEQIANPAGWLTVVAHRRAVDEHRARGRARALEHAGLAGGERDIAAALDDRARLRELLEALRAGLSERERQAAALCYLQGLTRAEAAARMGIGEKRMRKLMDGAGRGLRGVAAKVGELARTIAAGGWCEAQGSLMRGLAFGVLDPRGERYRIATAHTAQCPACRAYVRSLRGLAAILPPSPFVLQWVAAAGAGGAGASAAAGAAAGAGLGPGALAAPGAAAGGSWWLAGGVGAKLAVGCVLAAGLGAGCVAIEGGARGPAGAKHARTASASGAPHAAGRARAGGLDAPALAAALAPASGQSAAAPLTAPARAGSARTASAAREFGPEGSARAATASEPATAARTAPRARAAAASSPAPFGSSAAAGGTGGTARSAAGAGAVPAAQREFAPG